MPSHILKNIFKLLVIVLGLSINSINADRESIEQLIYSLEDQAQHLTLNVEDLTYFMDQIFNDEDFVSNEFPSLITALQFALSTARHIENSELIVRIQGYLRDLDVDENLTPPMTQYE